MRSWDSKSKDKVFYYIILIYHGTFPYHLFIPSSFRPMLQHTLFLHASQTECMYCRFPRGKKRSPMRLCDCRRTASSRGLTDVLISQFCMRNAFPPLKVCSVHGEYGREKCKRMAPIPESSLPPHRDSHNSRSEVEWIRQKKKKKVMPHPKRGLRVKDGSFFFFF